MLKLNVEYGGIKSTTTPVSAHANSGAPTQTQQASAPSNTLALPGIFLPLNPFPSIYCRTWTNLGEVGSRLFEFESNKLALILKFSKLLRSDLYAHKHY